MKSVRLSEFRERRLEDDGLRVEMADGTSFVVPPPDLWPEDVVGMSGEELIKALVGDHWMQFVAEGGTAALLNRIWADREQIDMGEPSASQPS